MRLDHESAAGTASAFEHRATTRNGKAERRSILVKLARCEEDHGLVVRRADAKVPNATKRNALEKSLVISRYSPAQLRFPIRSFQRQFLIVLRTKHPPDGGALDLAFDPCGYRALDLGDDLVPLRDPAVQPRPVLVPYD